MGGIASPRGHQSLRCVVLGRPGELDGLLVLCPGLQLPWGWEYWVGRLLWCQGLWLGRGPVRGPGAGGARGVRVGGPWSPFTVEGSPQDDRCQLEVLHAAGVLCLRLCWSCLSEGFGQGIISIYMSVMCCDQHAPWCVVSRKWAEGHTLQWYSCSGLGNKKDR